MKTILWKVEAASGAAWGGVGGAGWGAMCSGVGAVVVLVVLVTRQGRGLGCRLQESHTLSLYIETYSFLSQFQIWLSIRLSAAFGGID